MKKMMFVFLVFGLSFSSFADRPQKDGRRVNLLLTQLGQETLNKIVPDMDIVYKNIQKRYGEEKLAKLLELLGGVSEWRGR